MKARDLKECVYCLLDALGAKELKYGYGCLDSGDGDGFGFGEVVPAEGHQEGDRRGGGRSAQGAAIDLVGPTPTLGASL